MSESLTLTDMARSHRLLKIRCERCDRRGKLSLPKLMAEHGPSRRLPDLAAALSKDCTVAAHTTYDRCQIVFPQLS